MYVYRVVEFIPYVRILLLAIGCKYIPGLPLSACRALLKKGETHATLLPIAYRSCAGSRVVRWNRICQRQQDQYERECEYDSPPFASGHLHRRAVLPMHTL